MPLIIVSAKLEISLRVIADRTYVGSCRTDHNVAAVAAFPDTVAVS